MNDPWGFGNGGLGGGGFGFGAPGSFTSAYFEDQPAAAYQGAMGFGNTVNPRTRFLRSMFPQVYSQYLSQVPQHPLGTWGLQDFLGQGAGGQSGLPQQLQQQFMAQPAAERGLDYRAYQAPTRYFY